MGMQAFNNEYCGWRAWKDCKIEGGIIYASPPGGSFSTQVLSERLPGYNIFDYYSTNPDRINPPISEETISYILRDPKINIQNICLHHLFAAIDTSDVEQIKRFVETFGPPYTNSPFNAHCLPPCSSRYSEKVEGSYFSALPVTCFIEELKRFQQVLIMLENWEKARVDDIVDEHQIRQLEEQITISIGLYITTISPSLDFKRNPNEKTGKPLWTWRTGTLINALYFMLFMDLTTKGAPYKCADPECNQFFYPIAHHKRTSYCSATCQNRVNQRKNKARKKKVRTLWREGKSPGEIASMTGLKISKVTEWVGTFKR